ncbi:unnamed protein product [Bursaphelenchus okinawaensis]|uniref:Dynamin-type G domain-containing protein n=1 Tax=Bursaphelenchus okinawaensis TaxID=465554 RepID=A0A811L8K3_9BILA|nr:unnamed protein product [Bursaphelenchus okinawaensis]CAG9119502.1 unnamed protein product [Bursaphelenchus okinawaensis]
MCKANKSFKEKQICDEKVIKWLMERYQAKVVPVETRHSFERFHSPRLTEAEFEAKPVIMLLGQYSTGKTSMIKYLCNEEYPGSSIGPEPTTDSFNVVHYAEEPHITEGMSLTEDTRFPFQGLKSFGTTFCSHLRGCGLNAPLLKYMSLLDTPGLLAGEKHTTHRQYDFNKVIKFLSDKVDLIFLLFDTTKLDTTEELKQVINCLRGNEEKVRILLNKADLVDEAEMIRVRGALMWNLSKILVAPEVPRVYIGSFTRNPIDPTVMNTYKEDYLDMFSEILWCVNRARSRKINDLIKRIQVVEIHAGLMTFLCGSKWKFPNSPHGMAKMLNEGRIRQKFMEYRIIRRKMLQDLPDKDQFRKIAVETNRKDWVKEDPRLMKQLHDFLETDIPAALVTMEYDENPSAELQFVFKDLIDAIEKAPPIPPTSRLDDDDKVTAETTTHGGNTRTVEVPSQAGGVITAVGAGPPQAGGDPTAQGANTQTGAPKTKVGISDPPIHVYKKATTPPVVPSQA